VAHAILPISDKGSSDWGYALVPIIGPMIAGGIAAAIIKQVGIR
jgi:glycerol uptake facilitator protein